MEKVRAFAAKHKKLLIIATVLIVIVALIALLLPTPGTIQGATRPTDVTVLARTDLTLDISATGTVQSTDQRNVTSSQSYEITEILVAVGDTVTAGQQVAVLNTAELEQTIKETKEGIATQNASDSLSASQAQRNLQNAIDTRDSGYTKYDNEVNEAQTAYDAAIAIAEGDAQAQSGLDAAIATRDAARANWEAACAAYDAALENTPEDAATLPIDERDLYWQQYDAAYQAAELAQQTYDMVYAGHAADIAKTQTQLETAKTTRDTMNKQNEQTVQTYQDTVDNLNVSDTTRTMRNQLASYERQLENATVTAPISGTITEVNATLGATPMSSVGALFVIEDTQNLEVPLSVAEYDISDVQLGMQVTITSDAVDNAEWQGTVTAISPTATDTSGNFTVDVRITSSPGLLKSGMSAKASIHVSGVTNVFAVPFDAVVEDETGALVVYEYLRGEGEEDRRAIPVTTGLEGDYYIEIIGAELTEGLEILNDPMGVNVTEGGFNLPMMGGGF